MGKIYEVYVCVRLEQEHLDVEVLDSTGRHLKEAAEKLGYKDVCYWSEEIKGEDE